MLGIKQKPKPSSLHTLYFFRHGQTDWNKEGRIQGHLDVPLNDVGREQARRLISPAKKLKIEAFLSSDLSRAHESAQLIASGLAAHGLTEPVVHRHAGLREIYLGKVQGLTRQEIEVQFGSEFSGRLRSEPLSDEDVIRLGSESGEQVISRVTQAIAETLMQNPGHKKWGISTHGGVVRRIIQFSKTQPLYPSPIPNGVIYPVTFDLAQLQWWLHSVSEL